MHGSPLSRINNLDLWQTHDYKALGEGAGVAECEEWG
jgi:hypothetical protein